MVDGLDILEPETSQNQQPNLSWSNIELNPDVDMLQILLDEDFLGTKLTSYTKLDHLGKILREKLEETIDLLSYKE